MLAVRTIARRRLTSFLLRANAALSTESTVSGSVDSHPAPPPASPSAKLNSSQTSFVPASTPASNLEEAQASKTYEATPSKENRRDRKRRRIVKKRPQISLTSPRKWNPPVRQGTLPVYDEAVKLIREDSENLKRELKIVLARVSEIEKELPSKDGEAKTALEEELQGLREKVKILEIQSEINLPWVRWYAANGMADLTKPVYRHLVEQKWRSRGDLDLLMERIHQMHVVPDLLPELHPSTDLRVSFPEPPPQSTYLRTRTRRKYKPVEPGIFLLPEQARRPPRMYTSVFHTDTRFYTLFLIDADVPDPENKTFTTYLHWMQPNIALSAAACGRLITVPHTKYIPPHPERGSPYHRYCLFLLPHVNVGQKIHIPTISEEARTGFNLREFCEEYGLDASKGGGAHIWREVWNETVSDIYKNTLKLPEPHYGLPPHPDPYADLKGRKKFAQ